MDAPVEFWVDIHSEFVVSSVSTRDEMETKDSPFYNTIVSCYLFPSICMRTWEGDQLGPPLRLTSESIVQNQKVEKVETRPIQTGLFSDGCNWTCECVKTVECADDIRKQVLTAAVVAAVVATMTMTTAPAPPCRVTPSLIAANNPQDHRRLFRLSSPLSVAA